MRLLSNSRYRDFYSICMICIIFIVELIGFTIGFLTGLIVTLLSWSIAFSYTRFIIVGKEAALLCLIPVVAGSMLFVNKLTVSSDELYQPYYSEFFAHVIDNNLYAHLADSLLHGRVDLNLPVPQELAAMKNPYDYGARYSLSITKHIDIYFDYAFFNGKYYSYFGILPALLLYIPYQLITGSQLNTPLAIQVLSLIYIGISAAFVYRLISHFFNNSFTALTLGLSYLILVASSNIFYLCFVSRVYSVPIITSMIITLAGLWLWLGARITEPSNKIVLSKTHLFFGTLLIMLNLMSRPQFILSALFAFPIFWTEIIKDRLLFSKHGFVTTIFALFPILLIIVPFFIYNYIRFGDIFNIGSSYNLTGFDMTTYRQDFKTTLDCLYYYLFQPISLTVDFPFIQTTTITLLHGPAPHEPMFGGIFFLLPFLLTILLYPYVYSELKKRRLTGLCAMMFIFTVIVVFVDSRKAGITQRYFSDFTWYLAIISILVLNACKSKAMLDIHNCFPKIQWELVCFISTIGIIISICIGSLSFLNDNRIDGIKTTNPNLYEIVYEYF